MVDPVNVITESAVTFLETSLKAAVIEELRHGRQSTEIETRPLLSKGRLGSVGERFSCLKKEMTSGRQALDRRFGSMDREIEVNQHRRGGLETRVSMVDDLA
jgi:hypothetical protein